MGDDCSTCGRDEKDVLKFSRKTYRTLIGRHRHMLQDNVKRKVNLELSQCSPWSGSRGVAPLILTLSTRLRFATSRTLRFTPVKELQYILNGRLGGPQNRSRRFGGDNSKICFKINGVV